jgi:imidazolonepropionase
VPPARAHSGLEGQAGIEPGAKALRRATGEGAIGVLRPGSRADVHVLDAPFATHLAYRPGVPLTWAVWRAGHRLH